MDQRIEFALKALTTMNFQALCREYGISRKTGYKWKERFLEHGLAGVQDQSRRPLTNVRELSESVICELVRLKQRHPKWGPEKIHSLFGRAHDHEAKERLPSLSSVKRVLDRAGLVESARPAALDKAVAFTADARQRSPMKSGPSTSKAGGATHLVKDASR